MKPELPIGMMVRYVGWVQNPHTYWNQVGKRGEITERIISESVRCYFIRFEDARVSLPCFEQEIEPVD